MADHVHEDDAAALLDRQPHERMEAGSGNLAVAGDVCGVNKHVRILLGADAILPGASPQKVQSRIVGDAKQPALRMCDRSGVWQCLDRLDQRLLHHVLAIDDRTGHACAVAMQLRAQFAEQPIKRRARFNWAGVHSPIIR